jgi:hypothetical protein
MTTIPDIPATVAERWLVELCTKGFEKLHEVEAGEFAGVVRRNTPGQWSLSMPLDEIPAATLAQVGAVRVSDASGSVFEGWVSRLPTGGGGGVTRSLSGSSRRVMFEGVDAWWPMTTRLAFPDPTTVEPWTVATDDRDGVPSTVAADYINANMGAGAIGERQVPDLVVADPVVGAVRPTVSARLEPLSSLVGRICNESEIVCVPSVDAQRRPVVQFRQRKDLSSSLILSDQGDLVDVEIVELPSAATWVLAGGKGEGSARAFGSRDGGAVGLDRVESFTEQTNAQSVGGLKLIAEVVRRDSGYSVAVSGAVSPARAQSLRYGVHYGLGDILGVQIGDQRYAVPVTAVTFSVTAARSVALPVLGQWTNDRLQGLRRDVLGLADRFDRSIA